MVTHCRPCDYIIKWHDNNSGSIRVDNKDRKDENEKIYFSNSDYNGSLALGMPGPGKVMGTGRDGESQYRQPI